MRVITGLARGRKLKTLEGKNTRPTSDKVKESMFNIIQFELAGKRVLDLFGGSGQLAIEAVSRGAAHADIIDNSRAAYSIIQDNVKNCGFTDKISIRLCDYSVFLKTADEKYDIVFLDPPYDTPLLNKAISMIIQFDILSNSGIIICEFDRNTNLCDIPETYSAKEYSYGRTNVCVFRKVGKRL
jgi:16S rRNA (guanine(966)-N(2))-methyltransferase RsmD